MEKCRALYRVLLVSWNTLTWTEKVANHILYIIYEYSYETYYLLTPTTKHVASHIIIYRTNNLFFNDEVSYRTLSMYSNILSYQSKINNVLCSIR